jgi:rod shape-determining protein MreD
MPLLHSNQRLLLPVNPVFIFLTLVIAVLLNCLPFLGKPFVPDFVALILSFWAIHEPRRVSMGAGFVLGLFMDVISSTALGQYALAYVVLTYLANRFSRRVLSFDLPGQIFHVLPMLLVAQGVVAAVGFVVTDRFVEPVFFSSMVTAGLLWPLCDLLLIAPQRRAVEKDENRPI